MNGRTQFMVDDPFLLCLIGYFLFVVIILCPAGAVVALAFGLEWVAVVSSILLACVIMCMVMAVDRYRRLQAIPEVEE